MPFFRQSSTTTINPLFTKENHLTRFLLIGPPLATRHAPAPSHVTASSLAKFGTLPSSDSFRALLTAPLFQPAFSTEGQDVEIEFIGRAPGSKSGCLFPPQRDYEISVDPGEGAYLPTGIGALTGVDSHLVLDTVILDPVIKCARQGLMETQ